MTSNKTIHPGLIRAYREAKYVIEADDPIFLKIGEASRQLSALLKDYQTKTAAFITAFNPFSETLGDDENHKAQSSLIKDIKTLGYSVINGYGQDVEEQWPRELSTLAFGITESEAESLSDKYGQNAFVWIGSPDAYPSLRLRYPIGLPTNSDFAAWISGLPEQLAINAKKLSVLEQAWLMSVSEVEQVHWLNSDSWDLNVPWPVAKPDGSSMGIGTELDRMFKLIAAGQSTIF